MSTNEMDALGDRSSVQSGMVPFESNNFLLAQYGLWIYLCCDPSVLVIRKLHFCI